ncbi:hypothetical protein Tco_1139793 [Tanacetum coccineum]
MKLACAAGSSSQSESYKSIPSDYKIVEYTALLYDHYPLKNYLHNSESVALAYQLGSLDLMKSLVDCDLMSMLRQGCTHEFHNFVKLSRGSSVGRNNSTTSLESNWRRFDVIVKKQLVLKMILDESLEMIEDESLEMIVDEKMKFD